MSEPVPKSVYIIGILVGIPVLWLALTQLPSVGARTAAVLFVKVALQLGSVYAVVGLAAGFFRPNGRWHWGVALAIPLVGLSILNSALEGELQRALIEDAEALVGAFAGGTVGGQLGAWLRNRGRSRNTTESGFS